MKYDINPLPTTIPQPGKSLFLLGQAEDGPVNTPVLTKSQLDAKKMFQSGNLLDAYSQIVDVSGVSVYLMRITGEYSRVSLLGDIDGESVPVLKFHSIYGGEKYNSIYIYTHMVTRNGEEKKALIIESPDNSVPGVSYVLDDYNSLYELIYDINRDTRHRRNWVFAFSEYSYSPLSCLGDWNNMPTAMTGGDDGLDLTKDELYIALDTSYSILEGQNVDVICPYPVRFDDTHPAFYYDTTRAAYGKASYNKGDYLGLVDVARGNKQVTFHEQLIDFCKAQERFGMNTHGIIGLREVEKIDEKAPYYVSRLLNVSAFNDRYGLIEYKNGTWIDKGHYISVLAQDYIFKNGLEANGCALYAGIVASLNPNETTTNRPLPEGVQLKFELTPNELRDLAFIGAVGSRNSIKFGPVVANGVTASLSDSPFYSIQNIRMIQFTLYALNKVLETMIGEPFVPVVTLREINRRVHEVLVHCQQLKILREFVYDIHFDSYTQGVIIDLELMPRNSTEFIDATASFQSLSAGGA